MPRTYDAEFRRRVVELVRAGRPVRVVAAELGLAEATVHRWKAQDLIDRGVKPGLSTSDQGELAAARSEGLVLLLESSWVNVMPLGRAAGSRQVAGADGPGRFW